MITPWLIALALAPARPAAPPAAIGFVSHYPMVQHDDLSIPSTGADTLIVRAPWVWLEPAEGKWDFHILDQQLEYAQKANLKLMFVMEAGPTHAAVVPWLMEKVRAAGETQAGMDGAPAGDPAFYSPTYRKYLSRYLRAACGYLQRHRLSRYVAGAINGCEWWYPLTQSYPAVDVAAFKEWLRGRYGSLARLNARWGATFSTWPEAPRVAAMGNGDSVQGSTVPASALMDACYCTTDATHPEVKPGDRVTFTARFDARGARLGGATAEIAWRDGVKPQAIKISISPLARDGGVTLNAVAPPGARRAWLLIKSRAGGKVTFSDVSFRVNGGPELAPNPRLDPALGGWQFVCWSAGEPSLVTHEWSRTGQASISYASSLRPSPACDNPLAAVYDWEQFRAISVARLMEWMAREMRSGGLKGEILSYLTFAFSNPFEWDYESQMAIQIDTHGRLTPTETITGLQLASGEGDTDSVTCAIDMARKYGKPVWAIDLQDFTRGVALGSEGLARLSRSVFQHGGRGIQYYCWWGTPLYDYAVMTYPQMAAMIASARKAASVPFVASQVALVQPRMPLYQPLPEAANDWAEFMGWYKLLVHQGIRPDVYTLEELGRPDLARHRLVIVPDAAYIEPTSLAGLTAAARRGARIVVSGRLAHRDLAGRRMARPILPRLFRSLPGEPGRTMLGEAYREKSCTDTPSRLVCRPGSPHWSSRAATAMRAAVVAALAR